ncbi:MAG: NADP-dependent malic enzyme [Lachnospirales bacterium]
MDYNLEALKLHKSHKGKLEIKSKIKLENKDDLSIAYTPGVAEPCREIHKDPNKVYDYTIKSNTVAVVSDGSAVLGLGNIGPKAAIPVMEGKSILFKEFANIDAFPICLDTQDTEKIIETVKHLAPVFGGINLEDISAPKCFEIEARLKKELEIPVFHDDQHGTAIVVAAAVINSLKLVNKKINEVEILINGSGSAGSAICKLLLGLGVKNIVMCDIEGILEKNMPLPEAKLNLANITNKHGETGSLKDAFKNKDIFIGVSAPNIVTSSMISEMKEKSIVLAMANPIPEIMPEEAKKGGAYIVGTGRSDFPNQINNVLAFPGIFRGALDARAKDITEEMKLAAAYAIAESVENDLNINMILPLALDKKAATHVAKKVFEKAMENK